MDRAYVGAEASVALLWASLTSAGSLEAALPSVLYTSSRSGCAGPVGLRASAGIVAGYLIRRVLDCIRR